MLLVSSCFASIITQDTVFQCVSSNLSSNLMLSVIDLRHYQTDADISNNSWKSIDGEPLVDKHMYSPTKKGYFRFELTHVSLGGFGMPSISIDTLTVAVNENKTLVISIDGQPSVCEGQSDKLFYADSALLNKSLVWSNGDTAFHTNMIDANYTVRTQKEDEDKCLVFPISLPAVKAKCSSTGIQDLEAENAYSFFPNPTSGIITIQKNDASFSQNIFVHDVLGNIVMKVDVDASLNNITIDLSSLMHGCYFICSVEGMPIGRVILN